VPPARFRRADRILRPREFREVIQCGERVTSGSFVVFVAPARGDDAGEIGSRLGITVSRRVGNAVARNHVKRRIREWFRAARASLGMAAGVRLVVIARPGAAAKTFAQIAQSLDRAVVTR
jgi:ribonuclease P protein component